MLQPQLIYWDSKLFSCGKIENILNGSLDSIPSPPVKVQIMGGKSLLEVERQNIAGHCQQTFENNKFVDIIQVNFPAII